MNDHMKHIFDYRNKLKEKLTPTRYEHSLSVAFTCISLAMRYEYDLEKAEIAGILHDCGKLKSEAKIIEKCIRHNVVVTEEEMNNPAVLHANLGAWLARNKYGVEDEEILSAILYHTTGRPEMTVLEKIVYLADYIEVRRGRDSELLKIRKLAFEDLDECMYQALKASLSYLRRKKEKIVHSTVEAYAYYEAVHYARGREKGDE